MPVRVPPRDSWSRMGFLLASIGAAVGVGNIWRFPYMAGMNGGGAFLVPYFVGVLLFSLPLMLLELDAGRSFRGSVLTVFRKVCPRCRLAGLLPLGISLGVAGYYLVVTGWSLAYFTFSLPGYIPFGEFTSSLMPLGFFLISLTITSIIISRGIKRGIERLSMVLMPVFFLLIVCLAAYSLTLPGAGEGLAFYLTPEPSALMNPGIWVLGIVQAFFSLAIGYGILLTYASYLSKKQDIRKYAVGIAGADTLIALLGGLLVFPIVFTFGLDPSAGSGLTFLSLPGIFSSIPWGQLLGAAFFLLLFVAGLTSAVGLIEVGASGLIDELSWTRRKSALACTAVILAVGIPSSLSFYGPGIVVSGLPLLDFLDIYLGKLLLVSAAVTAFVLTQRKPGFLGKGMLSVALYRIIRYVMPPVLFAILLLELII